MERIGDCNADHGGSGSRDGGGWPWKSASTACRMKANAERLCNAQVVLTDLVDRLDPADTLALKAGVYVLSFASPISI